VQSTSLGKLFVKLISLYVTSPLRILTTSQISCYSYILGRPPTEIEQRIVGYMFYVQILPIPNTRPIQRRLNSLELCENGNIEFSSSYDYEVGCHSLTES
jgi:hypothetical protein